MKKLLSLALVLVLLLPLFSCNDELPAPNDGGTTNDGKTNDESIAEENEHPNEDDKNTENLLSSPANDFLCQNLEDGTVAVSYKGTDETVIVPTKIDGKDVVAIAQNGFEGAGSFLKKVVLPDTIKRIEEKAFINCSQLSTINIPVSVSYIGVSAFQNCSMLKTIEIKSDCLTEESVDVFAFSGIESVVLGEGVDCIPDNCFMGCPLSMVKLPYTVAKIGNRAFAGCNLQMIELNEGVITIGHKAFEGNSQLKMMVIPQTVCYITEMAFSGCSGLERVEFRGNAPETYEYSDPISGVWEPIATNYTIYFKHDAQGFTTPTWYGYLTEILP